MNFFDADGLAGKDGAEIDFFAAQTDAAATGNDDDLGGFFFQREMHAFVTAILLGMAWLDPFDADAEPEPPNRQLAQVEESVSGSERNTVIAADVGGQAALLKKPFKHGESVVFFGGREASQVRRKRLA